MMEWIAAHAPVIGLILFFALFLGAAIWTYLPANKKKMEAYGKIPLRERQDGQSAGQ